MAWVQPPEEAYACEILRRAIGATFTELDDNSRPGMPDGLFVLPDGVEGALEVTTAGDAKALELEQLTLGRSWDAPGRLEWAWNVWVEMGSDVRVLDELLIPYLELCERTRTTDLRWAGRVGQSSVHQWMGDHIRGVGTPESTNCGQVNVLPDTSGGGAVGHDPDVVATWAEELLLEPLMVRKLDKLARSGLPEQHLAVRVHEAGLPWPVLDTLMFRGELVPTQRLTAHNSLTCLWLLPRRGVPLRWSKRGGWKRDDVLGPPPAAQ